MIIIAWRCSVAMLWMLPPVAVHIDHMTRLADLPAAKIVPVWTQTFGLGCLSSFPNIKLTDYTCPKSALPHLAVLTILYWSFPAPVPMWTCMWRREAQKVGIHRSCLGQPTEQTMDGPRSRRTT